MKRKNTFKNNINIHSIKTTQKPSLKIKIKNNLMKENTLLKIAIICSLIGLVVLYFISAKIEISDYKPSLPSKNIGDDVKLEGTITKITAKDSVVFIELKQENNVNIVMFTDSNPEIKEGNVVEIIGKVQQYNSQNEIIANKIRIIKS